MLPPAIALLDSSCAIKPAWAHFDPIWYQATYQYQLPAAIGLEPQGLLAYYLETGCRAGHSPSFLFDEQFYLSGNSDIVALVEAGHYRSGFDHFCQYGHRQRSPHWLFDDIHYGYLYEDMALDYLDLNQFHGRYDHYLKCGQHEHRSGHLIFDSRFYQDKAVKAGDDENEIANQGAFTHYLKRLHSCATELPPSNYFDPAWYSKNHEPVIAEIRDERLCSALQHYLTRNGTRLAAGDPVAEFSEQFYRMRNPDVRHGIDSARFRNGYHHFIQLGAFELRQPSPDIDLLAYRDGNSRVRSDLNAGLVRDAFAHLRAIGEKNSQHAIPFNNQPELSEVATKQLFIRKARTNLALFARRKIDFTLSIFPAVSVIMVLFEKFELTMLSLCALRENYAGAIELIIIDNASSDSSSRIDEYVDGAKITLLEKNIGYLRACNLGLQQVTSDKILFLNNDVELGFGAIAAAIERVHSDRKIGAVGGKVVRTHGRLQEAGSIVWKDGTVTGYMRDALPLAPEANFVREVDFCSGVFLLCRANLVEQLGGFDLDFSPAYYEDVDLCVRIAAAGYRIVYDPSIVIYHLEYGSAFDTDAAVTLMSRGRKIFIQKHEEYLKRKLEYTSRNFVFARISEESRKRILFIEDRVPLRHLGSGYVRANDIVRAISATGCRVSVFPLNRGAEGSIGRPDDFPDDVEILNDRDIHNLAEFLEERCGYYDAIWVSRTHNLDRVLPILKQSGVAFQAVPIILDTEAIATLRNAAHAVLKPASVPFDFGTRLRVELAAVHACRQLIAVNRAEARLLRDTGFTAVSVLGTFCDPQPTPKAFSGREGLLFVASIHQPDSPNLDALHWYADAILPALALEMRQLPRLTVVGHIAAGINLDRFANHAHIRILGATANLRPYYDQNRLFIAPTRFAAGTPYKVYETASFGLPCVTTNLLASQLGWTDGIEILASPVTDAKIFAAQIAYLYRSEGKWNELRDNALARIAEENTAAQFYTDVANILRPVFTHTE